jgi:uncharacterized protein
MIDSSAPNVVVAGGSGFLGRGLVRFLRAHGYTATILSRSGSPAPGFPAGTAWLQWDGRTAGEWASCLDGAAAVVNLVGRSVDCRKTPENVRAILESRVDSCRALGEAVRKVANPPPVWVQAATAHIVGDPEPRDTVCDDSTSPGPMHEMAPRVGVAWEAAFAEAKLPEQRGVVMRISFVLGAEGGAFGKLEKLALLGLGGTVGRGDQWISWIHEEDLDRVILLAIQDEAYEGAFLVTAPEPVTNREFMTTLRRTYRRPWAPPAPSFAVRLAARLLLDTDPDLVLLGRRCVPTRLLKQGFEFRYPRLSEALFDLRSRRRSSEKSLNA